MSGAQVNDANIETPIATIPHGATDLFRPSGIPGKYNVIGMSGRRDMKRFFDRVSQLKGNVETYHEIKEKVQFKEWLGKIYSLHLEFKLLHRGSFDSELLFEDGSMFSKTLQNLLTAEQADQYRRH
ncbi:MAG TPA: hypothetical protein VGM05_10555 [Planctomycetaceae bacterium]